MRTSEIKVHGYPTVGDLAAAASVGQNVEPLEMIKLIRHPAHDIRDRPRYHLLDDFRRRLGLRLAAPENDGTDNRRDCNYCG